MWIETCKYGNSNKTQKKTYQITNPNPRLTVPIFSLIKETLESEQIYSSMVKTEI